MLENGSLTLSGSVEDVVESYLKDVPTLESGISIEEYISLLPPDPAMRLLDINLRQNGKPVTRVVFNGLPLEISIRYRVLEPTTGLRVFFDMLDTDENLLFRSFNDELGDGIPLVEPGEYKSKAVIPADILSPVDYNLVIHGTVYNIRATTGEGIRIPITVHHTGNYNRAYLADPVRGKLAMVIPWATAKE
jgi:lipopolysaccharide transport system ATP-binding protein